jgi:hypothetical protein
MVQRGVVNSDAGMCDTEKKTPGIIGDAGRFC